jgi:CelD/BcsL family acetyltransferase involved in cellulose biosynthesis
MKNLRGDVSSIEVASNDAKVRSLRFREMKNTSDGSGLRCEVISDFSELQKLSSDWERLWQADPRGEIFQTFAWARAWWRSFGHDFTICCPVVFEGNNIIGILPLVKRGNIVQFLGIPEADYADMLCEKGREAEVLTAAVAGLFWSVKQWDECILSPLAKDGRILRHCDELPRDTRRRLRLVPADGYQTILLHENREQIFNSLLGKHHTRRRQNKLKKAGRVTLRPLVTKLEAQEHLNYFFLHHIRRGALLGRESACARPAYRQFLRAIIEELDPNGRLRFEVMELDGRPFAWHFSFLVNGKFLLYQHTFDLESWDYAPGEVLLSNLLQFAQENVAREFDFGSGDEAYKARFARHTRETFSVYVEPAGLGGKLRGLLRVGQAYFYPLLSHLKKRAKANSGTFRLFRSIRISVAGSLSRIRQDKRDGALLRHGLHRIAQVFRNVVWGKEELHMFPWETLVGTDGRPSNDSPCNNELEIKTGGFGDLVDLTTERPDAVVASELAGCRQRLKKGDQIHIGRKSGHAVLLAWTSTDNADDVLTRKLSGTVRPDRPALVMYDFWAEPALSQGASYRQLLSVLRLESVSKKLDLLICVGGDQKIFQTELEYQAFRPQYRIVQYSLLHFFRWTRFFRTTQIVADPLIVGAVGI